MINKLPPKNQIIVIKKDGSSEFVEKIDGLSIIFCGSNNSITVVEGTDFQRCRIVSGDNMVVNIKESRHHIKNLNIVGRRAHDLRIQIGKNFSCVGCGINLCETGSIFIGDDCMFSFDITIWTSDSHTIFDNDTKECLNLGCDVNIGKHVWVGYNATIIKGTSIPDNTVIGACALVTGIHTKENTVLAGTPAKIVREGTNWSRKSPENYNQGIRNK